MKSCHFRNCQILSKITGNQWHLRQALARSELRDMIADEVARLRSGHQLEFWAMVWSSAEADSRDLLFESLQPGLLTRHPHMASISACAFHLFHNEVRSREWASDEMPASTPGDANGVLRARVPTFMVIPFCQWQKSNVFVQPYEQKPNLFGLCHGEKTKDEIQHLKSPIHILLANP